MATADLSTPASFFESALRTASRLGLGTPILILVMLAMMVLPLPALALDILFTFNIALSLLVLLTVIYTLRPLDFAAFPTILLLATLLRLALNVASTRVVMLEGHQGTDAAGKVIEAFGDFVVGGNYTVGLIVFAILVIINFVVITKGAGRISEVTARFTLDAMPGKQRGIDADLNAGLISQDTARARRDEVAREADFYGSMDGASKFVRGDAIAGILILFINIVGGFLVGVLQHDLSMERAAEYYTLLTIGDGLVAQIPALLLSVAAGIVVTRASSSQDMSQQMISQLIDHPRALFISGAIVGSLGLIPGMPNLAFLSLGGALIGIARYLTRRDQVPATPAPEVEVAPKDLPAEAADIGWKDVRPVDVIGLEVGYRLISLVDRNQGGELLSRIKGVRRKLSQELGFLIPSVHIHDDLSLPPSGYRITLLDVPLCENQVQPGMELAINPGQVFGTLEGIAAKEPAFNLDAVWIHSGLKDEAQAKGYTVVDCSTVIATHLSQVLKNYAHELLGHDEVQQLVDLLAKSSPKLVESLIPNVVSLSTLLKVLQNLLEENVSIRNLRTIAETLAKFGAKNQDPDFLTGALRTALRRTIYQTINGMKPELEVIALAPELEQTLQATLQGNAPGGLEPGLAEQMITQLKESVERMEAGGKTPVLLVAEGLRLWLSRLVRSNHPGLHVLTYSEIPNDKRVKLVATIGQRPQAMPQRR